MSEKIVTFLDILGFKEMLEKNTPEEMDSIVLHLYMRDLQLALGKKNKMSMDGRTIVFDENSVSLNCILMSDSIVIWTEGLNEQAFTEMLWFLRKLMHGSFLFTGIHFRGAISCGDFRYIRNDTKAEDKHRVINQSIGYGKALSAAYQLEKIQNWAGCIIDKEVFNRLDMDVVREICDNEAGSRPYTELVVSYHVPTKKGFSKSLTVNWIDDRKYVDEAQLRSRFLYHKKTADDAVAEKIENTVNHFNYVRETIFKVL